MYVPYGAHISLYKKVENIFIKYIQYNKKNENIKII